ncbi:MAG: hypothetical protein NC548_27850 [Lachnospiraceae bacterium]|nr:hypothetical protein [Lachnospiraceae bacterium]
MGYLATSSHVVTEETRIMSDILESQFVHFVQGQGTPVLTTWFTVDQVCSTVTPGLETTDELLGPESGLKYHRIDGVPVLGLTRDMTPELNAGEGNVIDFNLDIEVTTLPGTFKPKSYDYVYHRFGKNNERSVLFRAGDPKISSIKSNFFHKVELHAIDIDDNNGMYGMLLKQVTKTFRVNPDRIGTQEGCIVEETVFDQIKSIDDIFHEILSNYIDYFYNARYNAIIYREPGIEYPLYDPYLTKFLIASGLFEKYKKHPIALVDIDDIPGQSRAEYNKTMYRAIELRKRENLRQDLKFAPTTFSETVMTPFDYYGDEIVFKASIYEDPDSPLMKNAYMNYPVLKAIEDGEESMYFGVRERLIYRYFTKSDILDFITDGDLEELRNLSLDYADYDVHVIPIVLYIIEQYQKALGTTHTAI